MPTELEQLLESLRPTEATLREGGGRKAIARQHDKDRLTARERILRLIDPDTFFLELGLWAAFSPDGRRVASGHWGEKSAFLVRLWVVETGKELHSLKGHGREVTEVHFLPDGRSLLSAGMDGSMILWDVETGKEKKRLTHEGGVYGAAVSPDGKRALTAGFSDRLVRLWNLSAGKEIRAFEGHLGGVLGVAFSADGKRALSSDSQCTLRLWRLP